MSGSDKPAAAPLADATLTITLTVASWQMIIAHLRAGAQYGDAAAGAAQSA